MWLFLVNSEHVKGKEAVSQEIGNLTTNSTSGTRGKAWVCNVSRSESKRGGLEGQVRRQLNVYKLEELREEVIMEQSLKLMKNTLRQIGSKGKGEAEYWRGGDPSWLSSLYIRRPYLVVEREGLALM